MLFPPFLFFVIINVRRRLIESTSTQQSFTGFVTVGATFVLGIITLDVHDNPSIPLQGEPASSFKKSMYDLIFLRRISFDLLFVFVYALRDARV